MAAERKVVDWGLVEPHYRAGIMSLAELGKAFGVSDVAIHKHAKKNGWIRDLQAKVKAKADAKVSASVVSAEVRAERELTEKVVVEANATAVAKIRIEHRTDIARAKKLFLAMLEELETTSSSTGQGLLKRMIDVLTQVEDGDSKEDAEAKIARHRTLNALLDKTLALGTRIDSGKKLVEMLEKLVRLEREAWGIDDDDKGESPIDSIIKRVAELKRNGVGSSD